MHRSANAKWHMRNLETVIVDFAAKMTVKTARFPSSANIPTSHTAARKAQCPMTSSQGLKASGSGKQVTCRKWRAKWPHIALTGWVGSRVTGRG